MAFRMSEQPRTIKIYNLLAGTKEGANKSLI
ncbi:tail fiber chaperone%3B Qin prophage [Escherichia coli]|nr:tail fiber chaperone%3B Qin prophage [Escherichia coli]